LHDGYLLTVERIAKLVRFTNIILEFPNNPNKLNTEQILRRIPLIFPNFLFQPAFQTADFGYDIR